MSISIRKKYTQAKCKQCGNIKFKKNRFQKPTLIGRLLIKQEIIFKSLDSSYALSF